MNANVTVRIPAALRPYAGGAAEVRLEASDVGEMLAGLGTRHPDLLPRIVDSRGEVREFVNLFVGDTHIAQLSGLRTTLHAGATITILPSVAGG